MIPKLILLIAISLLAACCKPKEPAPNPTPKPCEGTKVDFTADFEIKEKFYKPHSKEDSIKLYTQDLLQGGLYEIIPKYRPQNCDYSLSFNSAKPYFSNMSDLKLREFGVGKEDGNQLSITLTFKNKNDTCLKATKTKIFQIKYPNQATNIKGEYLCTITGLTNSPNQIKSIFIDSVFNFYDDFYVLRMSNLYSGYNTLIRGYNIGNNVFANSFTTSVVPEWIYSCSGNNLNCGSITNSNLFLFSFYDFIVFDNKISFKCLEISKTNTEIENFTVTGIKK